jgi:hypothetical protein
MGLSWIWADISGNFGTALPPADASRDILPDATNTQFDPTLTAPAPQTTLQPTQQQFGGSIVLDGNCATIAFPQPRNAFRAWKALGEPETLIFHDLQGPYKDPNPRPVTRKTLPWWVHVGDKFCKP